VAAGLFTFEVFLAIDHDTIILGNYFANQMAGFLPERDLAVQGTVGAFRAA
jgi:hypothetical protein